MCRTRSIIPEGLNLVSIPLNEKVKVLKVYILVAPGRISFQSIENEREVDINPTASGVPQPLSEKKNYRQQVS